MAKKRRTRKQKERADLHHHDLTSPKASNSIEQREDRQESQERSSLYRFAATTTLSKKEDDHKNPLMTDYHFLKKDLIKTGILTLSIILAQIALFFVLNNK